MLSLGTHSDSVFAYMYMQMILDGTVSITKTRLFKYIENFTAKNWKFSYKNSDIFYIFAQNIDCVYSLEPPCWGGSNEYTQSIFLSRNEKKKIMYTPVNPPQFYYI